MNRSSTVGIPSCRTPPFGFGISTCRTGVTAYVPASNFARIFDQCRFGCPSSSVVYIRSIPGAPALPLTARRALRTLPSETTSPISSSPAHRPCPISLPVPFPAVVGLPPASFRFTSRLRLALRLRLVPSPPFRTLQLNRYSLYRAHEHEPPGWPWRVVGTPCSFDRYLPLTVRLLNVSLIPMLSILQSIHRFGFDESIPHFSNRKI